MSILKQKHRIYINTCRYSRERKNIMSKRSWKKIFHLLAAASTASRNFLKNWLLYPLIRCMHSNFQFKIHKTKNSMTANLNFKEGHLNSRTFQGQIHFQGVFRETPKIQGVFKDCGNPVFTECYLPIKFITEPRMCELINLIGQGHEGNYYRQYNMACHFFFYFYSDYDQTSRIICRKKNVHGNNLTLFCSSHVALFTSDISTPLVFVDLIIMEK